MENKTEIDFELQNYFEVMPDLMCFTNMSGQFSRLNNAWNQVAEKSKSELLNKAFIDFVHPDDHQKVFDLLQSLKSAKATAPVVLRIYFEKANVRFIEWRTTRLNDTIFWISRDITADIETQKKMQDIVIASEDFLEMLPEEIDFEKIADQLKEISGAKYVVINIFEDEDNVYTTKGIAGIKESIRKGSKILGFSFEGKKWPNDPIRYERTRDQSITRYEDLRDFAGHALPDLAISLIERTFNLGEVFLAKIEKDGIVCGDFTMIMLAGEKFSQFTLVDFFTRQVGLLITRHKAELALRKSEAKFRDLFDKDLTGNFVSTVEGEILLINEAFARIFGYDSVENLMKEKAGVLYENSDDRTRFINLIRELGSIELFEETLIRRDGRQIVVLENVIGEFDEKSELVRIKGYLIDITDRKQAENRLRDSERLLKESQEISRIGSYVLDIKVGIWKGSIILDHMFGIDAWDDHSVAGWLSVIHPEDREMMDHYFAHDVLEMHGRFDKEYRVSPKNGHPDFWVHGIGEVEFDKKGEPVKMIGTIQDITQQKLVNEALLRAKERAEASDRLKTAFLNSISHEVRTPLNGILGFGELITEPGLTPEKMDFYLEILNSSSQRLLNTINDYMDISLIASGNMEVRPSLFNLNDLINSLQVKYSPIAKGKNLKFKVLEAVLPKSFLLDTDSGILKKVLTHLLDNAVKYSSIGTIELGYQQRTEALEFFVKDEGIGISEDKQARIFEHFIQEDTSLNRKYEGSGLGLSIAKGLVELLGGKIWVESKEGKGSTFRFTIICRA